MDLQISLQVLSRWMALTYDFAIWAIWAVCGLAGIGLLYHWS